MRLLFSFLFVAISSAMTNSPIIAVLTQPTGKSLAKYGKSYIAASYVKYLEAGGARVVPLHYSTFLTNQTEFLTVLQSVNGVLFPGGGADIDPGSPMYLAASAVYSAARSTKAFPLMGHCLGFELICSVAARTGALLTPFDAENITLPLKFTNNATLSSLFAKAPARILDILTSEPVTMNNHMYGVSPQNFEKYGLEKDFAVLSTNEDRGGNTFVSTIEHVKAPIWAVQWHPEKNMFEWNPDEVINHSSDAILAMQYMSNFFVDQARLSPQSFSSDAEANMRLIYNNKVVYTFNDDSSFEECYFF